MLRRLALLSIVIMAVVACGSSSPSRGPASAPVPAPGAATSPVSPSTSGTTTSSAPSDQAVAQVAPDLGAADIYHQNWSASYADTTCADWVDAMNPSERFVAAADMLDSSRIADGAKAGVRAEVALYVAFGNAINAFCQPPNGTKGIVETAASVYTSVGTYRP